MTEKHIYLTLDQILEHSGAIRFVPATTKRLNVYTDNQILGFADYDLYNYWKGIEWRQGEQMDSIAGHTEHVIEGFVNGKLEFEATGVYAGNDLVEIKGVEKV